MEDFFPLDYPDFEEFGATPCSTSDPDAFFSDDIPDGQIHHRPKYSYEREAKATCLSCPYMARCLEFAIKHPDTQGIWGATNEQQRNYIRKGVNIHIGLPPSKHR